MKSSSIDRIVRPNRTLFDQEAEIAIFKEWRETGNKRLHEKIILNYTPIVYKVARAMDGYVNSSARIEREEILAEGMAGLCDAANRFDLNMGWRFSTYARTWVRGVVYAFIAKNFFAVYPCNNSTRKKMFFRLRTMIYRDHKTLGSFNITHDMAVLLANTFDTTPEEVTDMLGLFQSSHESLSVPVSKGNDGGGDDRLRQDLIVEPSNAYEDFNQMDQNKFHQDIIMKAIQRLKPREQKIFLSQRLTDEDEFLTLQTLGEEFKISRERVRQLRDYSSRIVAAEIRGMLARGEITRTDLFG